MLNSEVQLRANQSLILKPLEPFPRQFVTDPANNYLNCVYVLELEN